MRTGDTTAPYDVTVVMLTRDAGPTLRRILEAVFGQRTDRRFEVLAVDSGSMDGTLDVLRAHPVRLLEVPRTEFNWGATRELAYRHTQSPVIVNLSQDAVPKNPDWLDRLVAPLSEAEVAVSCGSSEPDPDRGFPQFPWERNGYFYFTREIAQFVRRYGRGVSFANSAVSREAWERLHLDPQPTGEDFQFQMKLFAAGLKVAFPKDAPVLHHHNYSLGGLWRRCRNEGFALRLMGCAYTESDLLLDWLGPAKYVQWLREVRYGRLHTPADFLFPVVRPLAVYMGSRFTRRPIWY